MEKFGSGCLDIKLGQKEQLQQLYSAHLAVNHRSVIFFSSTSNKCEYISVCLLFLLLSLVLIISPSFNIPAYSTRFVSADFPRVVGMPT
jgi:hypothetical protein